MIDRLPTRTRGILFTCALTLVLAASPAAAQTFVPDPVERTRLAVQLEKPFLREADGLAAYSSIFEADVIFPVGGGGRSLQIGVPLAFAGADGLDGPSVYMGSLRASLLFGTPDDLDGHVGITLPTASSLRDPDLTVLVGALPWLGELEKWGDAFSVRGAALPSRTLESGGRLGLRLGGAAVAPEDLENLFVYARVGGWGRFPVGRAELRADLGTSYAVNDDDGFEEQFTAYLDLGATMLEAGGRPGFFIRIPLDGDARGVLDFSIGISARF